MRKTKTNKLPLYVFKSPLVKCFIIDNDRVIHFINVSNRSKKYKVAIYDQLNIYNNLFESIEDAVACYDGLLAAYCRYITKIQVI